MSEQALAVEERPLSQMERVADTFVAPSKTFADVRRSASWWLPYLLIVLGAYVLTAAIQTKVGWVQLVQNEMHSNPKMAERMSAVPPDQLPVAQKRISYTFQYGFYASPVVQIASLAFIALILWMTINFGFGGSATYSRVLCVAMYSALPGVISALLAALLLLVGRSPESFTTQSLVGSNPGYYIDTPGALKVFLSSLDVFSIWTAVLLSMGLAMVANTKRSAGYISVFGWWVIIVLLKTAYAAVSS